MLSPTTWSALRSPLYLDQMHKAAPDITHFDVTHRYDPSIAIYLLVRIKIRHADAALGPDSTTNNTNLWEGQSCYILALCQSLFCTVMSSMNVTHKLTKTNRELTGSCLEVVHCVAPCKQARPCLYADANWQDAAAAVTGSHEGALCSRTPQQGGGSAGALLNTHVLQCHL